jgi:hypothetical protein
VTGYPDRPPGFQDHEDIQGSMHAGRRQRVADGGQTPVPWRLSRSVIDSVGPAGAKFARNADSAHTVNSYPSCCIGAQIVQFGASRALLWATLRFLVRPLTLPAVTAWDS